MTVTPSATAATDSASAAPASPTSSDAPDAPGAPDAPEPLLQTLQSLWRELPGLLSDRIELLSLELQRAGQALLQIVMLLVAVAILGVTAWLVLWAGVVSGLVALGLHLAWALLIALLVNLVAIAVMLQRLRAQLPRLTLPATLRHLTLSPSPEPPEPSDRDRPDRAGPPDHPRDPPADLRHAPAP